MLKTLSEKNQNNTNKMSSEVNQNDKYKENPDIPSLFQGFVCLMCVLSLAYGPLAELIQYMDCTCKYTCVSVPVNVIHIFTES